MDNAKRQNTPTPSRGMTYVTALDQIMSYYSMNIAKRLWKYLTIIVPFSKYQYMKMPMGFKIMADIFQREISRLFTDLDYIVIYLDDLLIVAKGSYGNLLNKSTEVFKQLHHRKIQFNRKKSFFNHMKWNT